MTTISNALQAVQERIIRAARQCGRDPDAVQLLAVSKTFGPNVIQAAYQCGQRAFGESYAQEAIPKMAALATLAIEWHFIGPIQSNKTKLLAAHFAWVHSIDREKVAQRISDQRAVELPPLQVCLQVNISGEASKSGASLQSIPGLAQKVAALPNLKLRGLMAIPEPTNDIGRQHQQFAAVRAVFDALNKQGFGLDTLSMGMSDDLEVAIAEGATMVRVGSAIFGARSARPVSNLDY